MSNNTSRSQRQSLPPHRQPIQAGPSCSIHARPLGHRANQGPTWAELLGER